MGSGALGMEMMQNEFSAIGMRNIWNDVNRLEKICEVEITLAEAQAELGIIPADKAKIIREQVNVENIDMRKLRLSYGKSGHFLSGFVKYFEDILPDDAGSYLHYGSTTQDILDTGMVLQLKEAHEDTLKRLKKLMRLISSKANALSDVVGVGRAHGNHAIPINYGYKLAIYLNELMDLYQRLKDSEDYVFTSAISGAVGSYAGYGDKGLEMAELVAEKLHLSFDKIGWHTQRGRFVEYTHILAMLSGVMGKMGKNLFDLSRSEIKEFDESYGKGRQGSTAMPTMRNPYLSEAVYNLANLIHNEMNLMYQSMLVSHEKDTIGWRNQWVAIPEITMYLSGQFAYLTAAMQNGTFHLEAIERNLHTEQGMLVSERLMMALSSEIGKSAAHKLIYNIGNESREENTSFEENVRADQAIQKALSDEELDELFNVHTYVGQSEKLGKEILNNYANFKF
ncbi:adenylosuccinate lyase [Atopostipes suicloacalis DSM 15692]|uniref:Adenylosuccinate lyase n=1 Tax=Atopostipes suicloacalis DSM 15692 TaxID=1121025 RepID=A0A1M4VZ70_9LACT|nr:adenylosuccinate lyase family protein [Atopostipes suicloacalis]SHE74278.1 adenylosuccinate lyase [Atopostipes suicloacalis DSM 15692]